ncbi:MAG: ABC transporter permease [Treponema sp.]|jgi:simple sugar transport system permease protein|nr:ABC transporter permease [Treponema sp.]
MNSRGFLALAVNHYAGIRKAVLTVLLSIGISVFLLLLFTSDDPGSVVSALFRGAFVGKRNLGTTLAASTTLLLNAIAFSIANKAGFFNTGIDGDMYMGALAATLVGIYGRGIPGPALAALCVLAAVIAGALWALIPALLNIHLNANVICVCIMMNSVANYICNFFIVGPLSAGKTVPQSKDVAVRFSQIMLPSRLNIGIFFSVIIWIVMIWVLKKTTLGYELKTVGENPQHAQYAGINYKMTAVKAMMISGALSGFAGCVEILGNYGYFLNEFASGLGSRGLLTALIVRCDMTLLPIASFFISALSSGAITMQAVTKVPKSLVDSLTALFIILATMETLFLFQRRKKASETKEAAHG